MVGGIVIVANSLIIQLIATHKMSDWLGDVIVVSICECVSVRQSDRRLEG